MPDWAGRQLGNYHLLRQLGKGGFGQVYLGEHIYLKTQAAIKFLLTEIDGEQGEVFREDFLHEAQRIAALKHPHILRVLEFGMDVSTPYLVMEYAAHGTLLDRHPSGSKVPMELVISYTKQIAQALQHAHSARLIHRDVKPANVLLDEQDFLLLSDFGIATIAHSTSSLETNTYTGTAAYMAPEQLHGKPVPASDQYALAIMVYEWLCGQRPYQGAMLAVGIQHLTAPIPSLRQHNPTLPAAVEAVVQRAMAKDSKQRFTTVLAFAEALKHAYQDAPIVSAPKVQLSPPPSTPIVQVSPTLPALSVKAPPTTVPAKRTQRRVNPQKSIRPDTLAPQNTVRWAIIAAATQTLSQEHTGGQWQLLYTFLAVCSLLGNLLAGALVWNAIYLGGLWYMLLFLVGSFLCMVYFVLRIGTAAHRRRRIELHILYVFFILSAVFIFLMGISLSFLPGEQGVLNLGWILIIESILLGYIFVARIRRL